jgi:6-phosphofructokinase 1
MIIDHIQNDQLRKKLTNIIVVAEGDEFGGAQELSRLLLTKIPGLETRVTILGHVQRGGAPTCNDRLLSSRLGYAAVQALLVGKKNEMAGLINGEICFTPFDQCVKTRKPFPDDMMQIVDVLTK